MDIPIWTYQLHLNIQSWALVLLHGVCVCEKMNKVNYFYSQWIKKITTSKFKLKTLKLNVIEREQEIEECY